jgi:hypothetical protein
VAKLIKSFGGGRGFEAEPEDVQWLFFIGRAILIVIVAGVNKHHIVLPIVL